MIEVVCESCDSTFRLKDESAGKSFRCKTCGESIRAPGRSATKRAVRSTPVDDGAWDEHDQPALPKPRTSTKKKRKRAASSVDFGALIDRIKEIDFIGIGGCTIAFVVIALFCAGFKYRPAAVGYMATIVFGSYLALLASFLMSLHIMVKESPIILLLCIIFPPYGLYYTVSRWEKIQHTFFLNLSAWAVLWTFGFGGLQIYRANGVNVEEWSVVFRTGWDSPRPVAAARPVPGFVPKNVSATPIGPPIAVAPVASADATLPFALDAVQIPEFQEMEGPLSVRSVPGEIYETTAVVPQAKDTQTPGSLTKIRLHLPSGDHGLGSLPCVLIAPAGATLLTGMDLDPRDNATETGPYIEQGYAVVEYSVDGASNSDYPTMMGPAYQTFKRACAGLANSRVALEFVLRKVPHVDPNRIYAVGHSSSGTLALLFAEHEPRIRGVVAYAPAADVESRLKDKLHKAQIDGERYFPGITDFMKKSSPKTHAGMLNCPVLLLHAVDDTNVSVNDSRAFQGLLLSLGKQSTLKEFQVGGHFQFMPSEGIPVALTWLNRLSNNTHPNAQLVVPQRNPEAPPPQLVPSQRVPSMTRQPVPRPITGRPPGL